MSQVLSQCMLLLFRHLLTGFWIHLYVQHFSCSTRHWTIFVMMIKDGPVSVCCRLIVVQNFLLLIIYYHHSLNIFMFLLEQQTSRGD